jgi:hypothetical protein
MGYNVDTGKRWFKQEDTKTTYSQCCIGIFKGSTQKQRAFLVFMMED